MAGGSSGFPSSNVGFNQFQNVRFNQPQNVGFNQPFESVGMQSYGHGLLHQPDPGNFLIF